MTIEMLPETRTLLGDSAKKCDSRSLFQDRFADPASTAETRKEWFRALISRKAAGPVPHFRWLPPHATRLHMRLEGRLMLNMAGGVMTNAALCLDRRGWPVIPGSAIKGAARRMALQALREWTEAGPNRPSPDSVGGPCRMGFPSPAHMLATVAQVFGWVEQDWKPGKNGQGLFRSDFGWACGEHHEAVWATACELLARELEVEISGSRPWSRLPNFAGSISFLPAHPNRDTGLDLDVLTPHHKRYYEGDLVVATDTEDPVPVFFPAISPQRGLDHFTFVLVPLRGAPTHLLDHARIWLAAGLQVFGIGAKTNAGYGWFTDVTSEVRARELQKREQEARKAAAQKALEREEAEKREKAALAAELEALPEDQKEDRLMFEMAKESSRLQPHLADFAKHPPAKQAAIVRWLASPAGAVRWLVIKTKGGKGKKPWSQILGEIHRVKKEQKLELP